MTFGLQPFIDEIGQQWKTRAKCHGQTDLFFPEAGADIRKKIAVAKAVCAICPVRIECLEYALQFPQPWHGIFGGLTVRERQAIGPRINTYIEHGTINGYAKELRLKKPTCEACREANAQYNRDKKQEKREHARDTGN